MQLKLAKIILSAIFILFHSSRSEFCHEAHGLIYNDQILIGGNYKSIITRGILVCSHKCLADPACTSYNYERSTESQGACELINEEAESTEVLQERKGSFFVRLRQKVVSYFSKICYYEMPLCTWRFWNRGGGQYSSKFTREGSTLSSNSLPFFTNRKDLLMTYFRPLHLSFQLL